MRVSLDLDGFGGQMDLAFTGLLHTLRAGQPAWDAVFGAPFWRHLATDPVMSASFDAALVHPDAGYRDAARPLQRFWCADRMPAERDHERDGRRVLQGSAT